MAKLKQNNDVSGQQSSCRQILVRLLGIGNNIFGDKIPKHSGVAESYV